jgi:hypothetical protein
VLTATGHNPKKHPQVLARFSVHWRLEASLHAFPGKHASQLVEPIVFLNPSPKPAALLHKSAIRRPLCRNGMMRTDFTLGIADDFG